jgi:5'(3')-deoxyribonucleotidase
MKRIAVDMDDVLADATGRFLEYYAERKGRKIQRQELIGKDWAAVTGAPISDIRHWLYEEGFFSGMKVIADSQDVLARLAERYEIFIVSAAMEFPLSLKEKLDWLNKHFPFISWKNIVFCGHKHIIKADYLIDDHEKNLKYFEGTSVVYTAPHNLHLDTYPRVNNWKEIAAMFL